MSIKLDTVTARDKLKPRREPYWQRLDRGCALGFRKMTSDSVGSWVARFRNPDTNERSKHALGQFDELPPADRFGAAKRTAEAWFQHLGVGGSPKQESVASACLQYVEHVRALKGEIQAKDMEARFKRWVFDDKLAGIALSKLTRTYVDAWRKRLTASPVVINPHADSKDQRQRARSLASVNRDMAPLRAALNYAHDLGQVTTDLAWRVALRPAESADRRRGVYLDRDQRRALVARVAPDLAPLVQAMCLLPVRPGALAALTVGSVDLRLGQLTIGVDKHGKDRKLALPTPTLNFLKAQCKDKLTGAPLFSRADGTPWGRHDWKKPFKEAARSIDLPEATTLYALRHSAITDLVQGGLDLLTTAQLSGTSVAMIERHYGHLRAEHAKSALASLAL